MDVDGTLTDGKIYMGNDGELFKTFNIKDGCGIHDILPQNHIMPAIITGRISTIVAKRCKELEIKELCQGASNKTTALETLLKKYNLNYENIAYIGDDTNDFDCMKTVKSGGGIIGCPSDAVSILRQQADYVCDLAGGQGAVREFIEWIISNDL